MTAMQDLFAASVLPGLAAVDDFVTADEERMLIAAIDASDLSPFRFQGWTGKRLTASFGWTYDFDAGRLHAGEPFPDWLLPFRDRAGRFAGIDPAALVQALLIRYDPGAGIGWHKDRPAFAHVVGVSLGAPAIMRFRRRHADGKGRNGFERRNVPMVPRGAYHLDGEARYGWEHSIAAIDAARWSVTFRSLANPLRRRSPVPPGDGAQ